MSVINQMLKDLDKRQNDQKSTSNVSVPLPANNSTTKLVFVIVAIIIIVNIVGIFAWQLYSENQQFKAQVQQAAITLKNDQFRADTHKNKVSNSNLPSTQVSALPVTSKAIKHALEESKGLANVPQSTVVIAPDKDINALASDLSETIKHRVITEKVTETDDTIVIITPVQAVKATVKPEAVSDIVPAKSSLTISRTQLSPKALAANKITQAEQAMERNEIAKAESLFEEILLVMPAHETARKQLAALWYGKKYYQEAVNLLSQGIALAPQAEEMRLMSARIYYEQGLARQAFNILNPVNRSNSTEVQTLLANTSAELNEHESAITAYRKLITLEPDVGRWWLGVAVSLDSLGKFVPARDAYKQSIARNNLSTSAMQFARQRLIELGE
tara:strand:- start:722 stop:1885 length:1164 start_codon:yes stop_codon:yes gene_type:complete